ncbi:MAG: cytochrome C551 [Nitrospiraceae bacterium]|nr:cytochrome C551 [Nitrospiraceae bacterium]
MEKPNIVAKKPVILTLEAGTYYWCHCGRSVTQPFCDGSHQGTEFTPKAFVLEEETKVWVCMCKYSKNIPFCDGAHKGL